LIREINSSIERPEPGEGPEGSSYHRQTCKGPPHRRAFCVGAVEASVAPSRGA
jgi:hypothetical protein